MIDKIIIVLFSNGIINELYILLAETKKQNLYLLEPHRKLAVKKTWTEKLVTWKNICNEHLRKKIMK